MHMFSRPRKIKETDMLWQEVQRLNEKLFKLEIYLRINEGYASIDLPEPK